MWMDVGGDPEKGLSPKTGGAAGPPNTGMMEKPVAVEVKVPTPQQPLRRQP